MDIQVGMGIHQLAQVERNWVRRRKVWRRYMEVFKDLPMELPAEVEQDTRHGYISSSCRIGEQRAGMTR